MESKISSEKFSHYEPYVLSSGTQIKTSIYAIRVPVTITIYNNNPNQKLTINANTSKELQYDADATLSLYIDEDNAFDTYYQTSYTDADKVQGAQYSRYQYNHAGYLGPILGFYTGASHWAVSGINRLSGGFLAESGRLLIANTNSSSASIDIDTTSCHVMCFLLDGFRRYSTFPSTSPNHLITDYLINSVLE